MSATPTLPDLQALLAPIPGENPMGEENPRDVLAEMNKFRTELKPEDCAVGEQPRKPDFGRIAEVGRETLARKSKNLVVAVRLTEALARKEGFPGLRDGIHLLREMLATCWDRMSPVVEDGDLEGRLLALEWLDQNDRVPFFPNTVRYLPLLTIKSGANFTLQQWEDAQGGVGAVTREQIERIVGGATREECAAALAPVNECIRELDGLKKVAAQKWGPERATEAPVFLNVAGVLESCKGVLQNLLKGKAGVAVPENDSGGGPGERNGTEGGARPALVRADIYKQLADAAARLKEIEPHSPIPYLIERAVELGKQPFPEMIKDFVRDNNIVAALNRELGIKERRPGS